MMNRHQRRAAAAKARRDKCTAWYQDYISHLPEVPMDAPLKRGSVYHQCYFHDAWCEFYATRNIADCKCNPVVKRYAEPVRQ
jgi:hypothetical protein